jgi:hypothetical protein
MHISRHRGVAALVAVFILTIGSLHASAQTGADLLVKPWEPGQIIDTSTDGLLEASGHTKETDDGIRLSTYHALGRWRILPNNEATPRLGYDVQYWDVNTSDPALPRNLWDMSIGFAQPVAKINDWFGVITGSVGYAGNAPFSDSHAVYFGANLIVGKEFSKDRAILMALNYNGNRTFFPDVPIPAFAYADRATPYLSYVVGLPYSSITYEPLQGLQFEGGFTLVETLEGKVAYQFTKHWALFGNYRDLLNAFHIDGTQEDRRLFLHTHTLEAGIRWNPTRLIRLSLSGGWAFGQEFSKGFDDRSLEPVRHLSDVPFGRAQLEFGF